MASKRRYDKAHRPISFEVGDKVYLRLHQGCSLPGNYLLLLYDSSISSLIILASSETATSTMSPFRPEMKTHYATVSTAAVDLRQCDAHLAVK